MAQTFDEAELLDRVDNDIGFLKDTVEMLVSDGPQLMEQISGAIAAGDAASVGRHAHALKGMLSNFCAAEAQAAAHEVEKIGKSGELSAVSIAMATLSHRLLTLTDELNSFLKARS